jgi:hypothetical protein
MIDEPPESGAIAHAYCADAPYVANRFAKLFYNLVCQLKVESAKPGYTPTVEQLYRGWSIEDSMNPIVVEGGTDFSAYHGLPIFSEMNHWSSGDVDRMRCVPDHTGKAGGFDAVVADNLLHAQIDGLPHLTDSIS